MFDSYKIFNSIISLFFTIIGKMPIKQNFLKKHKQISLFDKKNRMKKFSSKMCKKMGKKEVGGVCP